MKRIFRVLAIATLYAFPAAADELAIDALTVQGDFRKLSEDLAAALSYKGVTPATALGTLGFDIGIEVTATKLQHSEIFNQVYTGSDDIETLYVPKIHVHLGLPFRFDIGASYSTVPDTGVSVVGAELRYGIIEDDGAIPAIAVRGAYSQLIGVDQLEMNSTSLELMISKLIAIVTPYAGAGQVWTVSKPVGVAALTKEEFSQAKYFAGVNVNLGVINIAVEADKTGDATSYGAKLGWRF